jgi:hypothetical protein
VTNQAQINFVYKKKEILSIVLSLKLGLGTNVFCNWKERGKNKNDVFF